MARPLRIEYPGALYHITTRGNARRAVFKDASDRALFLDTLQRVSERYHWLCHAYCLMDNHYHLVLETLDGNLAQRMRQLNGIYTQAYNRRHRRVGHLFQGRYKAILVDKESYLLEVCRYVVLNPVRAKAVDHPGRWKWSSYGGTPARLNAIRRSRPIGCWDSSARSARRRSSATGNSSATGSENRASTRASSRRACWGPRSSSSGCSGAFAGGRNSRRSPSGRDT